MPSDHTMRFGADNSVTVRLKARLGLTVETNSIVRPMAISPSRRISADGVDLVRESVRTAIQDLIEADTAAVIGASRYQRSRRTRERITRSEASRIYAGSTRRSTRSRTSNGAHPAPLRVPRRHLRPLPGKHQQVVSKAVVIATGVTVQATRRWR